MWNESLPSCYVFSAENLRKASAAGKLGIFLSMHNIYQATATKLNRYIQVSALSKQQIVHHTSMAREHAVALLKIIDTLVECRTTSSPAFAGEGSEARTKFSSPFTGYAIVSAIDVLTAKVSQSSIPELLSSLNGAKTILAELALFWQSAKNQEALVTQRTRILSELASDKGDQFIFSSVARKTDSGAIEMLEALEKVFPREFDCVYA